MSTTTFNQAATDQNRIADTTARDAIYQLLDANACPVRAYLYGKKTGDAQTVTIQPKSGQTINGASSLVLTTAGTVTIKPVPGTPGSWIVVAQTATTTIGGGGGTSTGGPLTLAFNGAPGIYEAAYCGSLQATGGTQPYTYSITGSLPGGLSLDDASGNITGSPNVVGTFTCTGNVTDSTSGTPLTATVAMSITISAVDSSGPVMEVTITACSAVYSVSADGIEQWGPILQGSAPADPRFQSGQTILCPTCVLAAPGPNMGSITGYTNPTGSQAIGATSSSYAGGNLDIYVTPWGVPSQVSVSGQSVTITAGPGFNTALPTNYCLIGGVLCQVVTYTDSTHATIQLAGGGNPPSGTQTFVPSEARYGLIQVGDTVMMDGFTANQESFVIQAMTGVMSTGPGGTGNWCSRWTLTRTSGVHPAHNGATSVVAYGSNYSTFLVDIKGVGVDAWAGSLLPGATQSEGGPYNIGAPTAYLYLCVGVNLTGVQNPWPVTSTPHWSVPITAEVQTPGSIHATRIVSTEVTGGITGGGGYPLTSAQTGGANLVYDPSFDNLPSGQAWLKPASWSIVASGSSPTPHSGPYILEIPANATGAASNGNFIMCSPTQVFQASMWVRSSSASGMGQLCADIAWYGQGATFIGFITTPVYATPSTSGWVQVLSGPVTPPSGAVYARFIVHLATAGSAGNTWYVDDCSLVELAAVSGGALAFDSSGNMVIAPHSLSIGLFDPAGANGGAASVYFGSYTSVQQTGGVSGSNSLLMNSTAGIAAGYVVSGPGVAPGTTVTTISSGTVYLSLGTTVSGASGTYTFVALPSATGFPNGAFLFNVTNGRVYHSKSYLWVDQGDPGDLCAGVLAVGVEYAGQINCNQLNAGTVNAAITMTSPTLVISSGAVTVNIDATNYVKVTQVTGAGASQVTTIAQMSAGTLFTSQSGTSLGGTFSANINGTGFNLQAPSGGAISGSTISSVELSVSDGAGESTNIMGASILLTGAGADQGNGTLRVNSSGQLQFKRSGGWVTVVA